MLIVIALCARASLTFSALISSRARISLRRWALFWRALSIEARSAISPSGSRPTVR
jgi:hypothetical protein